MNAGISADAWHQLQFVEDLDNSTCSLVFDGSLVGTDTNFAGFQGFGFLVSGAFHGTYPNGPIYFDDFSVTHDSGSGPVTVWSDNFDSYIQKNATWNADTVDPTTDASGNLNWYHVSNWASNVAPKNDATTQVTFGNVLTADRVVVLDQGATIGTMQLDSSDYKYTFAGPGILTLAGAATIDVVSGSHEIAAELSGNSGLTKTGTGTLTLTGVLSYTGTTTVNKGTLVLNNNLVNDLTTITGTSDGSLSVIGTTTLNATSINVGTLTIGSTGVAAVPEPSTLMLLGMAGLALVA